MRMAGLSHRGGELPYILEFWDIGQLFSGFGQLLGKWALSHTYTLALRWCFQDSGYLVFFLCLVNCLFRWC